MKKGFVSGRMAIRRATRAGFYGRYNTEVPRSTILYATYNERIRRMGRSSSSGARPGVMVGGTGSGMGRGGGVLKCAPGPGGG